ncbi:MAG: ABC transporter ATP-binding protein [Candidatus Rokuibacteriota bacterium]|nr:MAG: ABC transporter ATP-binding protein [Candidatus Rokubacteria bacterium]PYM63414.1 MAG: ABC transporter ATP-binding protein [Candidatus Rokubacteria bacterium]PYN66335.1 MAG: ABC transporter ATP-binding protein [Candidatus Rokubacteria bacterium]
MSLLSVHELTAFYGDFQALFGVTLEVAPGELVAIIGANGAGKSTFLRTVVGLNASAAPAVRFDGRPIGGRPTHEIVALGIALVPEGRRIFPSLTVEENLRIGAHRGRPGPWSLARVYELFPVLYERRAVSGLTLSGGQQQMLAMGRAMMANPRLLLLDEVSLGLAPIVVNDVYNRLATIVGEGTTTLFVEQDVGRALSVCDRVYCFQEGRVSLAGRPRDLAREQIAAAYFGV